MPRQLQFPYSTADIGAMTWKTCVRMLIVALLSTMVAAAERYRFRNYGQDEGLNTAVSGILQDRTGFLWVGTGNGLFRYDGARFQRFGLEEGLPNSSIRSLHESAAGVLWVATGGGLARLRRNRFETVDLGLGTHGLDLHALASGNGKIYVGLDQGLLAGTLNIDGAPPRFSREPGSPEQPVWGIHVDPGGAVWFGSGNKLYLLDAGVLHVFDENAGLPQQRWGALLRDKQGNLWIRGPQHLFELLSGTHRFIARDRGLPQSSNSILSIVEDDGGTIMVATDQGLARWIDGNWQLTGTAQGLESDSVTSVFEDREHSLWIGMWGAGLARWPGSSQWTNWTIADGLSSDVIWAIRRGSSDSLWLGTDRGLLRMDSGVAGRVWKQKDGLGGDKVKALAIGPDGAVWAACLPGGVSRLDPGTSKIRTYGRASGLGDDRVVAIHIDRENRVWASTAEGLFRSDGLGPGLHFERQVLPGAAERALYYRFLADGSRRPMGWKYAGALPLGWVPMDAFHYRRWTEDEFRHPHRSEWRRRSLDCLPGAGGSVEADIQWGKDRGSTCGGQDLASLRLRSIPGAGFRWPALGRNGQRRGHEDQRWMDRAYSRRRPGVGRLRGERILGGSGRSGLDRDAKRPLAVSREPPNAGRPASAFGHYRSQIR